MINSDLQNLEGINDNNIQMNVKGGSILTQYFWDSYLALYENHYKQVNTPTQKSHSYPEREV